MWSSERRTTDFCGYLSIDSVGLLPSTVEQRPSFVLHVTNVNVVAIIFTKGDSGAPKHQEVVTVQNSCRKTATPNLIFIHGVFFLFVWLGFFLGGGGMKYQQCVNTSKMFRSTKYTMLHLTLMPALWACSPLFGSAASSLLQNDTSIAP